MVHVLKVQTVAVCKEPRNLATSSSPDMAAHSAGVLPDSPSRAVGGALCLSRMRMVVMLPWLAALWRGVTSWKSALPGFAPAARRRSIIWRWLRMVAAWRAVPPKVLPGLLMAVVVGVGEAEVTWRICSTMAVKPKDDA